MNQLLYYSFRRLVRPRTVTLLLCSFLALIYGISSLELTILHTNDVHARFEQTDQYAGECTSQLEAAGQCYGGVSRRMTTIKEIRNSVNNVLLLDAGDAFQGNIWFYVYKGLATAHFMNYLQYDAMSLGNHEFDNGIDGLTPFLKNITFPALSCNIDSSKEPAIHGLYVCSDVITLDDGEKIGIVGYTLESTPDYTQTGELVFNPELGRSLHQAVESLTESGINMIIAVGHSGIEIDKMVAKTVKGVDIVVGGHSNTFLYTGTPPSNEEPYGEYPLVFTNEEDETVPVLVVSSYAYGKYLGRLDVEFNEAGILTQYGGNAILLDKNIEQDPDTLQTVMDWKVDVDKIAKEVIGKTFTLLEGTFDICGTQECNLGNVLADAMVYNELALSGNEGWTGVAVAMTTAGSIAASIDSGSITIEQLTRVMPYGNTIDKVQLMGKHLWEVIEISVASYEDGSPQGSFLQVTGLLITYDVTRSSDNRVLSVMVRCSECNVPIYEPLNLEKVYTILMNSYQAGGGGGYSVVKQNKLSHVHGSSLDVDVTINYIRSTSSLLMGIEGRQIVYTASNPAPCHNGFAPSLLAPGILILTISTALPYL